MNAFVARLRAAPPAMWVALVGSVLSTILTIYAQSKWLDVDSRTETSFENYARLMMADAGVNFAVRAMMVAGILAAAAVSVRARTLLLLAAGLVAVLGLVRAVGWPLYPLILDSSQKSYDRMRMVDMAVGVGGFAALILIIVAAARSVVMPLFATLAVIGGVIGLNLPFVGEALHDVMQKQRLLAGLVYAASDLCLLVGLAGLLGAILYDHPATPEPRVAVRGLKRIERGLLVKAIMPVVMMLVLLVGLMGTRSIGSLKLVLAAGVLTLVGASITIGAGAMTLVRSRLEGLSASQLLVGAGMVMWWAIVYFQQALSLYAAVFGKETSFDEKQAFTVVGPVIAAGGFVLLGWAMVRFAKSRGDEELATSAVARTAVVVIIDVMVVLVTNYLVTKQPGPGVIFAVVGAIGSIIGTLAFAKLFDRIAAMVETQPALPTAAIVTKGAP